MQAPQVPAHLEQLFCLRVLQLKEKRVYDVKVIVQNITKGARNELEKLRAIWVWLCHNIGACSPNIPIIPQKTPAMIEFLLSDSKKMSFCFLSLRCEGVPGPDREADRPGGGDSGRPRRVLWLLQPLHGHVPVRVESSRELRYKSVDVLAETTTSPVWGVFTERWASSARRCRATARASGTGRARA